MRRALPYSVVENPQEHKDNLLVALMGLAPLLAGKGPLLGVRNWDSK